MSNRKLSRRQALLAAAAVPVAGGGLWAGLQAGSSPAEISAQQLRFEDVPAGFQRMRAAPAMAQLSGQADEMTAVWAYEGSVPGPEIRAVAGDRVRVRLENGLEQSTAVHWHGISIDNDMDGVPGLTQDAVSAGEAFDYDFVVPHPGTYWYHTHDRSWEQNARGLHGALIVEEPEPYDVDGDLTL
ncbi:MAG: multicopper oxidase domain-containing protein, partial [Actinomycetota bacterium]